MMLMMMIKLHIKYTFAVPSCWHCSNLKREYSQNRLHCHLSTHCNMIFWMSKFYHLSEAKYFGTIDIKPCNYTLFALHCDCSPVYFAVQSILLSRVFCSSSVYFAVDIFGASTCGWEECLLQSWQIDPADRGRFFFKHFWIKRIILLALTNWLGWRWYMLSTGGNGWARPRVEGRQVPKV